ncbi:hypothetical protein BDV35DRAFT_161665 [Aspergillus flavus]|uniref:Uncharacterized protein n=1 Tax=Aspergillus flavus TaxID=5059 RepID=A0A5N6GDQ5_ASPFL|nr:hypothetical protein BDV35DRAFT_161665 [Aspergillus flavus]
MMAARKKTRGTLKPRLAPFEKVKAYAEKVNKNLLDDTCINRLKSDVCLMNGQRRSPSPRTNKKLKLYRTFLEDCSKKGAYMVLLCSGALGVSGTCSLNKSERERFPELLESARLYTDTLADLARKYDVPGNSEPPTQSALQGNSNSVLNVESLGVSGPHDQFDIHDMGATVGTPSAEFNAFTFPIPVQTFPTALRFLDMKVRMPLEPDDNPILEVRFDIDREEGWKLIQNNYPSVPTQGAEEINLACPSNTSSTDPAGASRTSFFPFPG